VAVGAGMAVDEASLPMSEGVLASSQRLVQLFPQLENLDVRLAIPVTIVGSNWFPAHSNPLTTTTPFSSTRSRARTPRSRALSVMGESD
jgi:hypothetical protein